jgi:hypothetical protein
MYLMEYVGKYGNSNPHYISDWIESSVVTSKDKSDITGVWDSSTSSCVFPSAHIVQIFFSKINTLDDPQYQII